MAYGRSGNGGPSIAIDADTPDGLARCERARFAIGGTSAPIDSADILLVDLRAEPALGIAGHLDRLLGERLAPPVVLCVPIECVDAADAVLAERSGALLCEPSDIELAAALCLAAPSASPLLREPGANAQAERFHRLAEEIGRIGRALTRLSQAGIAGTGARVDEALTAVRTDPSPVDPARVRAVIALRRLRERFFAPGLFADPAWDILLDLMAAQLEGREVSVSSLCVASAVPPSTALRWIGAMAERGLLVRRADPDDRRRIFIELSDAVTDAMERFFTAIEGVAAPVV